MKRGRRSRALRHILAGAVFRAAEREALWAVGLCVHSGPIGAEAHQADPTEREWVALVHSGEDLGQHVGRMLVIVNDVQVAVASLHVVPRANLRLSDCQHGSSFRNYSVDYSIARASDVGGRRQHL